MFCGNAKFPEGDAPSANAHALGGPLSIGEPELELLAFVEAALLVLLAPLCELAVPVALLLELDSLLSPPLVLLDDWLSELPPPVEAGDPEHP